MYRIYKVILPILMLLLAAACSSDPLAGPDSAPAPVLPVCPEGPVEFGMLISLGDNGAERSYGDMPAGRATPSDGDYDPGAGYENFIDISAGDFALYIFSAGDASASAPRLIARAEITGLVPADGGTAESAKRYMCRFRVDDPMLLFDKATAKASFRLVMLANWHAWTLASGRWADYPVLAAGATLDELYAAAGSTREFPDVAVGPELTRDTRVPLFGVHEYSGIDLMANGLTDLDETLHLLRAFAKIEVYDAPDTKRAIESVSLTRCNTLFKCLPSRVYGKGDYVTGSHATDYVDHVSLPGDTCDTPGAAAPGVSTDIPFFKYSKGNSGKGSWIIYVPEYDNTSASATKAQIKVTYADKSSFMLDFKNYGQLATPAKNAPFDICRNNWYIYSLSRREHDVTVELDVQPYAECKVEPGLGLLADDMGDLMVYMVFDEESGEWVFPETFNAFRSEYGKELPKDPDGVELKFEREMGDYYAIHRGTDGTMAGSEIWLKDRDGDRVLTNFAPKDDNSQDCSTRKVIAYTGSHQEECHKDMDGDIRRQHNHNHSSVIYDEEMGLCFKDVDGKLYPVESWDESTGIFYVRATSADGTRYIFIEYDISGTETGNKVEVEIPEEERNSIR